MPSTPSAASTMPMVRIVRQPLAEYCGVRASWLRMEFVCAGAAGVCRGALEPEVFGFRLPSESFFTSRNRPIGHRPVANMIAISSHEPQSASPEGFFRGGLGRGVFTRGALPPASYWLICAPFCPWFPGA